MESTHRVMARFERSRDAREAMIDLEGTGIDADNIHLVTAAEPVTSNMTKMDVDMDVGAKLFWKGARGMILGGIIGVVVVVGALAAMRVEPFGAAVAIGALGGFVGGATIGAFYGMINRLPVNEEAFDTVTAAHQGGNDPIVVEVTLHDGRTAADAVNVLRRHHARKIDREVA